MTRVGNAVYVLPTQKKASGGSDLVRLIQWSYSKVQKCQESWNNYEVVTQSRASGSRCRLWYPFGGGWLVWVGGLGWEEVWDSLWTPVWINSAQRRRCSSGLELLQMTHRETRRINAQQSGKETGVKGVLSWRTLFIKTWILHSFPTIRCQQGFQWRRGRAAHRCQFGVRVGVGGFFRCKSHFWGGHVESVLRLAVRPARLLLGAGFGAADPCSAPRAVKELRRRPTDDCERFVLTCPLTRGRRLGGGVLLWGVGWQRLHAAHWGAAGAAAKGVTYAGTRKRACSAFIKICQVIIVFRQKISNTKNLEGFDAHFLHLPGTESGCRCCGAFGALWTDRWLGSCGNRSGSAAVAGARWGLEAGGISANKMNQIKSKNYASSSSKCFIVKSKQTSKMCLDYTIAAEGLGEYQTLLHYQSYAGAVIWGVFSRQS